MLSQHPSVHDGNLHKFSGDVFSLSDDYMGKQTKVAELLRRLSAAGKQLFLITNSGVNFV